MHVRVSIHSPSSPARDAYSLDEGQDTLKKEDEEEGHEVERAVSPRNTKGGEKKKKIQKNKKNKTSKLRVLIGFSSVSEAFLLISTGCKHVSTNLGQTGKHPHK